MGWQESHEVQKGEMQSLAPEEEKFHAPRDFVRQPAEKQICREGVRDPGGKQADCDPTLNNCSKEGQEPPELHKKWCCQ